jgi:hypothetical protein
VKEIVSITSTIQESTPPLYYAIQIQYALAKAPIEKRLIANWQIEPTDNNLVGPQRGHTIPIRHQSHRDLLAFYHQHSNSISLVPASQ